MVLKKFIKVSTDKLIPYGNNPRINEPAVADTMESIRQCENLDPIEVDEDFVILSGHTRLIAMQRLGITETEIVQYTGLTDEQKRKYRILANKTNELAEWDFEKLEKEMADLDFSDFSFDFDGIGENLQDGGVQEVDAPEPPEEPQAKVGDLYALGNHRLICADCTDAAVIDRLMDGVKAELCLIDPPYGINAVHKDGKVHGDSKDAIAERKIYHPIIGDDTTETARKNYEIIRNISKNQVIFGGNYFTDFLPVSRCWVVWDKKNGEGSFADAELAWTSFDQVVKLYSFMWNGLFREGKRDEELITRVHPTQKPVGMLAMILNDFTEEDDSVLDCFGGSGSTLIACEQLNRRCYMCELDPHYVDVIIERWETLTGQKAVKLN